MSRQQRRRRRAEAFIFDLDGTLVDSGRDLAFSANFVRARYGLPELPEQVVVSFVGDGVGKLVERALADLDGPSADERRAEGLQAFLDHHDRHCLDHSRLYPGVLQTLRGFAGFPLMVATNKSRRFAEKVLAGLHVDSACRRVVCGDDVARRQARPRGAGALPGRPGRRSGRGGHGRGRDQRRAGGPRPGLHVRRLRIRPDRAGPAARRRSGPRAGILRRTRRPFRRPAHPRTPEGTPMSRLPMSRPPPDALAAA
ncbi:MAG: HAD hydrolase-like protein [bacterium]|nr:HAD hydrolase-like protein [bacterium]